MRQFVVEHNTLEVDQLVFPGRCGRNFFEPNKWPEGALEAFKFAGQLCRKNGVTLLRGEISEKKQVTSLWVEAESENNVRKFYEDFSPLIKQLGEKEEIEFLTISEVKKTINGCEVNKKKIGSVLDLINHYREEAA